MAQSKFDIIAERQANLPLPEQPPVASDWNSADQRTVNVGSGSLSGDVSHGGGGDSLRGPATAQSAVRVDGEEWKTNTAGENVGRTAKDGLKGLPDDAVTKEAKGKQGLEHTTGEDYGYPHRSDPSSGPKN